MEAGDAWAEGTEAEGPGRGWGGGQRVQRGPGHTCGQGRDGLRSPLQAQGLAKLRPARLCFIDAAIMPDVVFMQGGDAESGLRLLFTSGRDSHIFVVGSIVLLQAEAPNPGRAPAHDAHRPPPGHHRARLS